MSMKRYQAQNCIRCRDKSVTPAFKDATSSWSSLAPVGPRFRTVERRKHGPPLSSPLHLSTALSKERQRDLNVEAYFAACRGDVGCLQNLLGLGASANSRTIINGLHDTFTPAKAGILSVLADAAGRYQLDILEMLLGAGADVNPRVNESSNSPLHEAVRADDLAIAHFLLEAGASVDSLNAFSSTPLMHAIKYSSIEMVSLLLSFQPSLHQLSLVGTAAVHWAIWPNRPEVLERLLKAGANPNQRMVEGSTPLHCAASAGYAETVECLLRWRANPFLRNAKWETPLDIAAEQGDEKIMNLLLQAAKDEYPQKI